MAAKFKRGDAEIRVQMLPGRMYPSLLAISGNDRELVASFKGEWQAKYFCKVMTALLKGEHK